MISRSRDGNQPLARIGEPFAPGAYAAGGCAWPLDHGSAHRQGSRN